MNIYRNWRDAGQRWWEVVIRPLGHTKLTIFFSAFVFFHLLQEWVLKLIRPFTNHESTTNHFPNIFNRTSSALYIYPQLCLHEHQVIQHTTSFNLFMAATSMFSVRTMKLRKLSKHIREQKARLYIIWRCSVMLLCWHD